MRIGGTSVPRSGLPIPPGNRWVVRGSVGMTYVPIGIQYYAGVPYGFAPGFRGTNNAPGPFNWDQGYSGVFQPGTLRARRIPACIRSPPLIRTLCGGLHRELNMGTQFAVTKNTTVEVSYIGNRGHRLQGSNLAYNEASATAFFNLVKSGNASVPVCDPGTASSVGVPYPFAGFCGPAFAAIAPYPQLAEGAAYYTGYPNLYYVGLPLGQSSYDSMVVELVKRSGKGLTTDMSYTLSRQVGDTFDNFGDSYEVALNGIQDCPI